MDVFQSTKPKAHVQLNPVINKLIMITLNTCIWKYYYYNNIIILSLMILFYEN